MAPAYKLTYFDTRGRAEAARMLFAVAGQEFEDVRLTREEWAEVKPKTRGGVLPTLETADGVMNQSVAIYVYIGNQLGLAPDSEFGKGQCLSIILTIQDVMGYFIENLYPSLVAKSVPVPDDIEKRKETAREKIVAMLVIVESISKPGSKFIFGDKITAADTVLFTLIETLPGFFPGIDSETDWIKTYLANMRADPKVAEYLKNRK